mgnify:CR=1 FL=1
MENLSEKEILDLIDEAIEVSKKAYVNYSHFPVGAVLIDENGRKFKGVNMENSSFGLSLCAERNAISTAVTEGMKEMKLIVVTGDTDGPISPCGACRQVMSEFAGEDTRIILSNYKKDYKIYKMEELLPYSFKL